MYLKKYVWVATCDTMHDSYETSTISLYEIISWLRLIFLTPFTCLDEEV